MKKTVFYILSALTLMFIGLKLSDKIDWSWWWVFSPVWIPLAVLVLLLITRLCTMVYLYKHDMAYRQAMDDYSNSQKQSKRTLDDRLKEMKEEKQRILEEQEKRKMEKQN